MSAPTFADYYEIGRVEMLLRQRRLVVRDGDVSDAMLRSSAAMADHLTGWAAGRVAATFLTGNRGDDLTIEARDRGVERRPPVSSIGHVTLSRVTSAVPRIVPAGTRIATTPDVTGGYITVATDIDLSYGIGETSKPVAATAIAAGSAGNVGPGTLTRVIDTLPEVFTATNAALFASGEEQEADEDLIDRTMGAWQNAARGTERALVYGSKEGGAYTATVTRDPGTNIITVYVTDRAGNANAALTAAVAAELREWQGAADVVNVVGGELVSQSIVVSLTVRAGVAIDPLVAFVRSAIVAAVNRTPIGATLYRSVISAAARSVSANITECVVVTPAANVSPDPDQVIRASLELVGVS